MEQITFFHPAKIVFGKGCVDQFIMDIEKEGKKNIYMLAVDALKDITANIKRKLETKGIKVSVNESLQAEPSFADLEKLKIEADSVNADAIVGVGGGSVMDTAKMLAAIVNTDINAKDYVGIGLLKQRNTYLACLPTTSGTGSEVSPNAIFLDEADMDKKGVISPFLVPDASYVDPMLTVGAPPTVTASTGLDALTHCIEAFVNKFAHPMTDLYALEGIRLIGKSLVDAYNDGNNIEARENLSLGSLYGGLCLGPVNTGAVHALSYPLGSKFKIPHGIANALLLPYVMQFNAKYQSERYAKVAAALGVEISGSNEDMAQKGVDVVFEIMKKCNVPLRLSEINISRDDFEMIATSALKVQRLLKNNVKEIYRGDALKIYENAY
ncbi:MAG: iron-containing alcohol dehydrogenase [Prolixibacteraceae bacterium]|jgi:alcohol dehydrogenase class IV|nr:iron-containing alcohol dehydrogenase [Prolixibacteraceae bacterium]